MLAAFARKCKLPKKIIRERILSHDIMMTILLDTVFTYMSPLFGVIQILH